MVVSDNRMLTPGKGSPVSASKTCPDNFPRVLACKSETMNSERTIVMRINKEIIHAKGEKFEFLINFTMTYPN
jgi:hypothetical protein